MVILIFALFVGILLLVQAVRRSGRTAQSAAAALASQADVSEGLFYAPGHMWASLVSDGTVALGPDAFLRSLMGPVEGIEPARPGAQVRRGDTLFVVLVNGRRIEVKAPADGVVEAFNAELLTSPGLLALERDGWVVRFRPNSLSDAVGQMRIAERARQWMRSEIERLRQFFANLAPRAALASLTMLDGGEPAAGALAHFDDESLSSFSRQFLEIS